MQRRVLILGACALIVVAGFFGFRAVTRHQAAQALDQGIDQFVARLPPGYAVRHGAVDYNPLTSAATVHAVVVTRSGATIVTADAVTVSGADDRAVQDVFDPGFYPGGKPAWTDRKLLIADASAQNVRFIVQGPQQGNLVIRSVTLHRLSGRPFMLPPTEENRVKPEFLADAALALGADTMEARDADLTVAAAQNDQAQNDQAQSDRAQSDQAQSDQAQPSQVQPAKGAMSVASMAISDYDSGKLGSLAIKTAMLDGDGKPRGVPVHVTIGGFDVKSANLRSVLEAIRRTGHADRGLLGHVTYESFGLADATLDAGSGPHLALQDMHATQTLADAGPSGGSGSIHGLTLSIGKMIVPPAAAASLAAFGMNAITMDVDATSTMQANTTQGGTTQGGVPSTVSEEIVLRGLCTLHVQGRFSGYDAALATPAQPLAALMATTLDHAGIVYEDHSLTNRLIAVTAAQTHSTPDVVRAQLAMPVLTLGLMLPNQPDAADQVTNFLNHPGTLTVTMDPPQKTTFAQVAQASVPARAQMLGIHITSK